MIRPANFPEGTPGVGMVFVKVNTIELAVINMQARSFMVDLDDPFRKMDELVAIARKRTPFIFVDFHGETTSENKRWAGIWMAVFRQSSARIPTSRPMMRGFCPKERLICQMSA